MTKRTLRQFGLAVALIFTLTASDCFFFGDDPCNPSTPARLSIVSGDRQSADFGTRLADSLVVHLDNDCKDPMASEWIRFVVTMGEGAVAPDSARTDTSGDAWTRWTLGPTGDQRVRASTARGSASAQTFSATGS